MTMDFDTNFDKIKVIDNFFSEEIHKDIWEHVHPQKPIWSLTGGHRGSSGYKFWHIDFLHKDEYFSNFLFRKIINKLGDEYKDYGYRRIYANGQTAGQHGTVHPDDGDVTFLYYPNPEWMYRWGGELIFCDGAHPKGTREGIDEESLETQRIVRYRPNRAVVFPAKILHHANSPARLYGDLRVSLAYKLIKPCNK